MAALPPGTAAEFRPALRLAAQLTLLEREIDGPDDRRWLEFWQIAEQFEACERSARRETGWRYCMFGYKAKCPIDSPVNCLACAGMISTTLSQQESA